MNNQAAQTMPELRELARRAVPFLRDEGSNYEDDGNNEPLELARAIEAALGGNPNREAASPGGCECEKCGRIFIGAEWHVLCGICIDHGVAQHSNPELVVVPADPTPEMVEAICQAHAGKSLWPTAFGGEARTIRQNHAIAGYRAMLAAAPAASGGEDDEAPQPTAMQIRYAEGYSDGVRDTERIAKEREGQPTSGASRGEDGPNWRYAAVSALEYLEVGDTENAIGMLKSAISMHVPQPPSAASVSERARELLEQSRNGRALRNDGLVEVGQAIDALEQALTQQRGSASYDAGMAMHWIERYAAGIDEECKLDRIAEAFTTPQPSADAVRELVKRWRDQQITVPPAPHGSPAKSYNCALRACADELESLLYGGSNA